MKKRRHMLPSLAAFFLLLTISGAAAAEPNDSVLKVCADPNNLPYSNAAGEGFENRLAELLAQSMGKKVEYTWWAQRRGFIRNTLKAGRCDVVMGLPSGFDEALTTHPYYQSSYVLVYRQNSGYELHGLDDPRLHELKIGVHLVGEGISPPAEVLARHGIIRNVVGYSIFGDYSQPNPPARLIEAVANRDIDVAVAWGPLAGYFAEQSETPLKVVPLPESGNPVLPFQFGIAMGVRPGDTQLRDRLDTLITQKQPEIHALLKQYGIPLVNDQANLSQQETLP
jgi:quinoprotein dehydrogenase-associated probable ABC transporter substrate-binding protein